MDSQRLHAGFAALAASVFLASCGGGGGSPGDTRPGADPPPTVSTGSEPKSFLLFPNPQVQADGTMQTNTLAYAQAYYAAIDPNNERDTLAKFKARNGFDSGTGTQILVIFGDRRDLGYGRRMTARKNPDGSIAFFVENYLIQAGAGYVYSPLNLDAAIVRDTRWLVGVNAIEFSPGPNGGAPFPKWFNYESASGNFNRALEVDLDGEGLKAMPGPCITCHGGRGDALTPPDASGKQLFNLVQNGVSQQRGDVQGRLHAFEPDVFDFSTTRAGFSRAEQEASIKTINTWILCTYPLPAPSSAPEDQCRRPSGENEWQSNAAAVIKSAYGGDGLPNAEFVDNYVPPGWETVGQSTLYRNVVAPSCRTCHALRGVKAQDDLDFTTYEKFREFSDRIKAHIIDRGNMPLAKIVFDEFYGSSRHEALASFLVAQGQEARDASGAALRPGRPIANPGPDRVMPPGAAMLSARDSLFASGFAWTLVSSAGPATLSEPNTATPVFTASVEGEYLLRLVASNGSTSSAPKQLKIVVKAGSPAPSQVKFADIKGILQGVGTCTNCHSPTGTGARPPVYYTNEDRNGDSMVDATDDAWLHAEVRGRVNFTELAASPLLRKPSGNHHGGGKLPGFDATAAPGSAERQNYDLFLNWILNGAPQ